MLFLFSVAAANGQDMTIRVMAYNILEGAYATDSPAGYNFDRADAIIAFINAYNPDILLLQECRHWADSGNTRLPYFSDHLGMPYKIIAPNHGAYKVALLSKYPIVSSTYLNDSVYFWWNILTASIQVAPSCTISTASIHFGWWGVPGFYDMNDSEQSQSYSQQKAVLMSYLQGRVNGSLIIGGDWNHDTTESPFNQGILHDEISAMGYGMNLLRRYQPAERNVDTLYVSRSGKLVPMNCSRLHDAEGLSDHLPIVSDIGIIFNPPPVIISQPVSQKVNYGSTAIFRINGLNQNSYAWYKSSDANNSTPGDDVLIGTDSNTLTINNVQPSNEGYYYCVLSNSYGSISTNVAMLMINRAVWPAYQAVNVGSTAVFAIDSLSQANYQWYKSPDPCNATPSGDVAVGTNSNVLTINNVQIANEGYYYCVVSISGSSLSSDIAMLMTKRMISRWKFENNLTDYIGGYSGTRINPAVYVTGIVGNKALQFSGDVNDRVVVPFKAKLNLKSFTISSWAKATGGSGNYGVAVSTRNITSESRQGYLFYYQPLSPDWIWSFWEGLGTDSAKWSKVFGPSTVLNQWVLLTGTYDYATKKQDLYINGVLYNSATLTADFTPNTATSLFIGCGNNETKPGNPFTGYIDDVQYYSYALSPQEIAQIYVDVTGGQLCVGPYSESDYNDDCVVDVKDFAEFADLYLVSSGPPCVGPYSESDYNHDCVVDLKDFAEFAAHWMTESGMVNPQ